MGQERRGPRRGQWSGLGTRQGELLGQVRGLSRAEESQTERRAASTNAGRLQESTRRGQCGVVWLPHTHSGGERPAAGAPGVQMGMQRCREQE